MLTKSEDFFHHGRGNSTINQNLLTYKLSRVLCVHILQFYLKVNNVQC